MNVFVNIFIYQKFINKYKLFNIEIKFLKQNYLF